MISEFLPALHSRPLQYNNKRTANRKWPLPYSWLTALHKCGRNYRWVHSDFANKIPDLKSILCHPTSFLRNRKYAQVRGTAIPNSNIFGKITEGSCKYLNEYCWEVKPKQLGFLCRPKSAVHHKEVEVLGQVPSVFRNLQQQKARVFYVSKEQCITKRFK